MPTGAKEQNLVHATCQSQPGLIRSAEVGQAGRPPSPSLLCVAGYGRVWRRGLIVGIAVGR